MPLRAALLAAATAAAAAAAAPAAEARNGTLRLRRHSSVQPGNLLPAFLFLQGESDGLGQELSLPVGGGRGEAIPEVPGDTCDDAVFEGANPDLRSPQLPYPRQDRWGCEREEREVPVVMLEDDAMQATVTPQWGGKVWSLLDKQRDREFFYASAAHQPANIGARGAWVAGGLEFNWAPGYLGHSAFTEERVWLARLRTERGDVLRAYEFDRYNSTVWQVDILVADGALWTHAKVTNPNAHDVPGYWWTCAAHRATPASRVVAPADEVTVESFVGSGLRNAPFPDLNSGMLNTSFAPREVDSSVLGNIAYTGDYFLRIKNESRRWIAHVAEDGYAAVHGHPLAGTKFFTWGQSGPGRFMQDFLAGGEERQGDYTELQSGVTPTQMQVFTLHGNSSLAFTEYFKPLPDAGGAAAGDYRAAAAAIGAWWDSAAGVPRARVAEMEAFFASIEDRAPTEGELVSRGAPWGWLEEQALGRRLAPGALFAAPAESGGAGDGAAMWRELVELGTFSAATLAGTRAPLAYYVAPQWVRRLEESAARHGGTWLHDLLLGVAYAEAGEVARPLALFNRSVTAYAGAPRSPVAARCAAVLRPDAAAAWAGLSDAWRLALLPPPAAEPGWVAAALQANLIDERARLCLGNLGAAGSGGALPPGGAAWLARLREVVADAAPLGAAAPDAVAQGAVVAAVADGEHDAAIAALARGCWPTLGRARGVLADLWRAAHLGRAAAAKGAALTPVEQHRVRKAHPVPRNIGCPYATLYCEQYW